MASREDIHLRKIEIAWEIAKTHNEISRSRSGYPSSDYFDKTGNALKRAWSIVDAAFPNFGEEQQDRVAS